MHSSVGALDDCVSSLSFPWDSKKYLSQKNVVEKLNANVMHGKVRNVRNAKDREPGKRLLLIFGQVEKSLPSVALVSFGLVKCTC